MKAVETHRRDAWYYRDGLRFEESSHSREYDDAQRLLRLRERDVAMGAPIAPKLERVRFDEA